MFGEKIEDYEILEHLGKGGFAHVYRARCRKTGIFVAIKMIDKALMASAGMIGRVRQEVTIHSRLKHPAILELYTFFEDAHYVYLVLELAHNGELAKHFKLGTCGLTEKAAADIFRQVVSGVLYLHTHNIIHRDLSLNNLLLTKDLFVKIADFGLATQLNGPDEKHVTMCGTPNYISPEVASRELHGLPADVWGLGCMLYTLLVGSPPFHTQHVKTTLNKVINADYKIPSELSFEAQDLLQKLLCKDQIRRITLKGIMEHPFLNNNVINNHQRHDLSRDSGFLTTLHSTQHSGKPRNDDLLTPECFKYIKENNVVSSDCIQSNSYNLFSSGQNVNIPSNKDSHVLDKNLPHFTGQKYTHSPSNSANLSEDIKKLDIRSNYHKCKTPDENKEYTPKPHIFQSNYHDLYKTANENKENAPKPHIIQSNYHDLCKTADENKENIPKPHIVNSNALNVPPLCAERLPNISHRTRNAILKIESNSVIVEFIKRKGKDREERVVEICKISKDGMKIIIYSVDKEKHTNIEHNPLPDEVFSYHNLPQKHWKKYLYAARFIDLVKAKTPKITLYTSLAKCQLMENGTDIEMFFYNGEKVTFSSSEGLKIIDKHSKTHQDLSKDNNLQYLKDHFEECSSRMNRIQSVLSSIPDECFPLIIGKRPVQSTNSVVTSSMQQNSDKNYYTPPFNIGSFYRSNSGSIQTQSEFK